MSPMLGEDPEERRIIAALRAAEQAKRTKQLQEQTRSQEQAAWNQAERPRQKYVAYDPVASIIGSLEHKDVGGAAGFGYRLETIADSWKKNFGTSAVASVAVDLARAPVALPLVQQALKDTARQWGLIRGLTEPSDRIPFASAAARGVIYPGWDTYSKAVADDFSNVRRKTDGYRPLALGPAAKPSTPAVLGMKASPSEFLLPDPNWDILSRFRKDWAVGTPESVHRPVLPTDTWAGGFVIAQSAGILGLRDERPTGPEFLAGASKIAEALGILTPGSWDEQAGSYPMHEAFNASRGQYASVAAMTDVGNAWYESFFDAAQALGHWFVQSNKDLGKMLEGPGTAAGDALAKYGPVTALKPVGGIVLEGVGRMAQPIAPQLEWMDRQLYRVGIGAYFFVKGAMGGTPQGMTVNPYWTRQPGDGTTYTSKQDQAALQAQVMHHEAATGRDLSSPFSSAVEAWSQAVAGFEGTEEGKTFSDVILGDEFGLDREKYGFTFAVADIVETTAASLGLGVAWRAMGAPQLWRKGLDSAIRLYPGTKEAAEFLAVERNAAKIAEITDLPGEVAVKVANASTPQAVRDIFAAHVVEGGGLSGSELLLKRRLMEKIRWSPALQEKVPPSVRRAYQIMADRRLDLHDDEIVGSVRAMGQAMNMTMEDTYRFADQALRAQSRLARASIMRKMWNDAVARDPEKYAELKSWWRTKYPRAEGGESALFAPETYAETGHAREMSVVARDAHATRLGRLVEHYDTQIANLEMREQLIGYVRPGEPDLSSAFMRKLGLTDEEVRAYQAGEVTADDLAATRFPQSEQLPGLEQAPTPEAGFFDDLTNEGAATEAAAPAKTPRETFMEELESAARIRTPDPTDPKKLDLMGKAVTTWDHFQRAAENLRQELALLMPSETELNATARAMMRDFGDTSVDAQVYKWIKENGRLSMDDPMVDQALSARERMAALKGLGKGTSAKQGESLFQFKTGRGWDEIVTEMESVHPEWGIRTPEDLKVWLEGYKTPAERLQVFRLSAEKEAWEWAQQNGFKAKEAKLRDYEAMFEEMGEQNEIAREFLAQIDQWKRNPLIETEPFARRPVDWQTDLLDTRTLPEQDLADLRMERDLIAEQHARASEYIPGASPAPLLPYQEIQAFTPEIPLNVVAAHNAGGLGALDKLQRTGLPGLGQREITLDSATGWWKRYTLASPGILVRILGDEPMRMLSSGYGKDALLSMFGQRLGSAFEAPSLQWMRMVRDNPEYAAKLGATGNAFSRESIETHLSYLFEGVDPARHIVLMPWNPGYERALGHTMSTLKRQAPVRVWLEGGESEVSLMKWALDTEDGQRFLRLNRGGADLETAEEWAKQAHEYFFKLTHSPVQGGNRVMGVLDDAELTAWRSYQSEVSTLAPGTAAPPPPFALEAGQVVAYGRVWNENPVVKGMMSGMLPVERKTLRQLSNHERPIITGRAPSNVVETQAGEVVVPGRSKLNVPGRGIDWLYEVFDGATTNIRSTIYAREFRKKYQELSDIAAEAAQKGLAAEGQFFLPDQARIWKMADRHGRRMVDDMTYNTQRTGLEYALRDFVPFAPATRDFATWWLRESITKPSRALLFANMQNLPNQASFTFPEEMMTRIGQLSNSIIEHDPTPYHALAKVAGVGLAGDIATSLAGVRYTFNPKSATFFSGGSTQTDDTDISAWSILEQQFPGLGPVLTLPAALLYDASPADFNYLPEFAGMKVTRDDLKQIPGLELTGAELPFNSRAERLGFAAAVLLTGMVSGGVENYVKTGRMTGGDWMPEWIDSMRQVLPGFLFRNADARNRLVSQTIRALANDPKYDWSDPEAAAKALELDAKELVGKREVWTAVAQAVMPMSGYLRDAEVQDKTTALRGYMDTFDLAGTTPQNAADFEAAGAVIAEQSRLRREMPELAPYFDYMDALRNRDAVKMESVATENPGVLSYFVAMYDDLTRKADAQQMEEAGIAPGSLEEFVWKAERDLERLTSPARFAESVGVKIADVDAFERYQFEKQRFDAQMASRGLVDTDVTYKELKDEFDLKMKEMEKEGIVKSSPWYQLRPFTNEERATIVRAATENRKTAEALAVQEKQALEGLSSQYPLYKWVRARFDEKFRELGLTRPQKAGTSPLDRAQNTLEDFLRLDPWQFTREEDFTERGLRWSADIQDKFGELLHYREEIGQQLKAAHLNYNDKKAAPLRAAYQDYVRRAVMADPAVGDAWDYYQTHPWERLRDSNSMTSPAWQNLWMVLAARDNAIDEGQMVSSNGQTVMAFSFNAPSRTVEKLRNEIVAQVNEWREEDPVFRDEFDRFGFTYFDKNERW